MKRFDFSVKLCIVLAILFLVLAFFVKAAIFGTIGFVIAGMLLWFNQEEAVKPWKSEFHQNR